MIVRKLITTLVRGFDGESYRRMAKWAVIECVDLLLVGSVFARAAHPELVVHQRTTGHNACRELGVAVGTDLTPNKGKKHVMTL